jgi:CRISPR system Cascade subunit CasC
MELIELHMLQSFPVTCLNRDDVGAPKSALFGGVQRARVSSQSWKRAIREMARELQPNFFSGTRTRYVIRDLKDRFGQAGLSDPEAQLLAEATADALGKLDNLKAGSVKTLLYFSPAEMQNVVDAVLQADFATVLSRCLEASDAEKEAKAIEKARAELVKMCEKPSKELKRAVKDAADIAVFGRMVADDQSLTVEGAGLFSHALSTHHATSEVEFFSAVDDKADLSLQGAGAGHIGTLEFNSACYYRYVGVNLDLLCDDKHLGHLTEEERTSVLGAVVRATLLAVPGARKNSMFGFNPPAFALGLRRCGHPLSLINAFEKPIRAHGEGYVEPSIAALRRHLEDVRSVYGLQADVEKCIPECDLDAFVGELVGTRAAVGA